MYSLTKATQLFLKHAEIGTQNASKEVQTYNSHKIRHSLWVLETGRNLIIKIQENTLLSPELKNRAEIALLLHDLWRFYQNNGERVLKNSEFEHGDCSYRLAQENDYDEGVCLAIKYHNKYSHLPLFEEPSFLSMTDAEKESTIFLTKLTRDADKLQNMIYTVYDIECFSRLNNGVKNGDISEIILNEVTSLQPVDRRNIQTQADDIVWVLCRYFDINFTESFEMLQYYGYLPKILQVLEKMPEVTASKVEKLREIFKKFM